MNLGDLLKFRITNTVLFIVNERNRVLYSINHTDCGYKFHDYETKMGIDDSLKEALLDIPVQYISIGNNCLYIHLPI